MASIWVESLRVSFEQALGLLDTAVRGCSRQLWETPMWPVPGPPPEREILGPEGTPVTGDARRHHLVQRHSTPWGVAWHALECFDYDLTGEFGSWVPPAPFAGHPHWRDLTALPAPWTQAEMLAYIDYCRERARTVLAGMTDDMAATPLPRAHRYHGQPHARILLGMVGHTTEHAAQVLQFVTASHPDPRPDA